MSKLTTVTYYVIRVCIWSCVTLALMSIDIGTNSLGWIIYTIGAAFIGGGCTWYVSKGITNLVMEIEEMYEYSEHENVRKRRRRTH